MANGPLNGVRILDLTHVWAGPLATRVLADLGAEVVKIERALGRGLATPVAEPIAGWIGGEPGKEPWNANASIVKLARNSQSVCLDLKHPDGKACFLELVSVADIVIENFSARAMPALGLSIETLRTANPNIIYLTMPGYGASGPYRDWVAFGPSVEPMSGITNVMGYSPDEPRNTAMALIDPTSGISATAAILTALRYRQQHLSGAKVEMSLHESGVTFSGPWLIAHQRGEPIESMGNRHPVMAPHGVYPCDGDDAWVAIVCTTDQQWRALCTLTGVGDPDAPLASRQLDHQRIDDKLCNWTRQHNKVAAAEKLQAAGVAAGPVYNTPDMMADTHIADRGFFVPLERNTPVPGNPIKMSGISPADWTPCPRLGADNAAVLKDWLGYDESAIAELEAAGTLSDHPPV